MSDLMISEQLSTLDEMISIWSFADREGFGLSVVHANRGRLAYIEFSWEDYGSLLKRLWEDYLTKGQKPKLAGQTLSDDGLVTETLHYIAEGQFNNPLGATLQQESVVYWLKLQSPIISARIDDGAFNCLDKELDSILSINLEQKRDKLLFGAAKQLA